MKFRAWGPVVGVVMLFVIAVVPSASANHPANSCIDLEPETSTGEVGTTFTLTATLRTGTQDACTGQPLTPDAGAVHVNVEISGANALPGTPDASCTIKQKDTSCTLDYEGVATGVDTIVAWIDHDKDDTNDQGEPSDSVSRTWTAPANVLDCDDQSGPDFEKETNVGSSAGSSETYTCTATTTGGAVYSGAINAEIENTVNDPDSTEGASHATPDYSCFATSGTCQITITQADAELGTALICFWIGTGAEGATLCASETTAENQLADGSDAGNDYADRVEKTWVSAVTALLDCSPEGAFLGNTAPHTIECHATTASGTNVEGAQIDVEIVGANDPDGGDTPTTPDLTCTTANNGRCTVTHNSSGATGGISVYRAWIDADLSNSTVEADLTEGTVESTSPGGEAEIDDTDVVERSWDPEPPPPPATCPDQPTGSRNHVVGTVGDDVLTGTDGRDVICGFGGNDVIRGLAGDDVVLGGTGNDEVRGGGGDDLVKGGPGDDVLYGGRGNDVLRGGRGNDICFGGRGRDTRHSC